MRILTIDIKFNDSTLKAVTMKIRKTDKPSEVVDMVLESYGKENIKFHGWTVEENKNV